MPDLTTVTRSRLAWVLPFLVSVGMAAGTLFGFTMAAGDALERDPVGSLGAVVTFASLIAGFLVSVVTVMVSRLRARPAPSRLALRFVLSLMGGAGIGALSWMGQKSDLPLGPPLLLLLPALLSLPWREGRVEPEKP